MIRLDSVRDLAGHGDVFLVDQYGTLHDGAAPYPGAPEALRALHAAGRKVALLTNSGRRAAHNADRLARLGFPQESYDLLLSSGELAWQMLSEEGGPGRRCLLVARGDDTAFLDGLGMAPVADAADADLVIIAGSEAERVPLPVYAARLRPAAERGVPCLCTNPDREMVLPGGSAPGAGRIAELYEMMGGRVTWIGKPHPAIYRAALDRLGATAGPLVIGIGDSLGHDVAGAAKAGCRGALLRQGLIGNLDDRALDRLIAAASVPPDFLVARFA